VGGRRGEGFLCLLKKLKKKNVASLKVNVWATSAWRGDGTRNLLPTINAKPF